MSGKPQDELALSSVILKLDQVLSRLEALETRILTQVVMKPPVITGVQPDAEPAPKPTLIEPAGHALGQWNADSMVSEKYAHIPKIVPDDVPAPPRPSLDPVAIAKPVETDEPLRSKGETEYAVGARALPIFGAILVLAAVGSGIALAIKSGSFGPLAQFWGLLILNGAFLLSGYRLRSEREEFGKVLMATGSVGVYFTLAGGHAFQHLYSTGVMTASFFLWGVANLLWSYHNQSKTFLILGHAGGLVAACLPITQGAHATGSALALVISLSSIPGALRLRHNQTTLATTISSLTCLFVMSMQQASGVSLAALAIYGIACLWAWATLKPENPEYEFVGMLSIVILGIYLVVQAGSSPLTSFGIRSVPLLFGVLATGFARFGPHRGSLPMVTISSWVMLLGGSLTTLAPNYVPLSIAISGALVAGYALATRSETFTKVSLWVLAVGATGYAAAFLQLEQKFEIAALATFIVAAMVLGNAAKASLGRGSTWPAIGLAFSLIAAARLHRITSTGAGLPPEQVWSYAAWGFAAVGLLLAGFQREKSVPRSLAAGVACAIAFVSIRASIGVGNPPPLEILLQTALLAAGILTTGARTLAATESAGHRSAITTAGAIWLSVIFLDQAAAITKLVGFRNEMFAIVAFVAAWICFANSAIAAIGRKAEFAWLGILSFAFAIWFAFLGYPEIGAGGYPAIVNFWVGVAGVVSLVSGLRIPSLKLLLWGVSFAGFLVLIATTGDRALAPLVPSNGWVMTSTFAMLGTGLVILGMSVKEEVLRYGGLGFFFVAIMKAAFVDIFRYLDANGRILGSLAIGCILIGTGFLYIRQRTVVLGVDPPESLPPD